MASKLDSLFLREDAPDDVTVVHFTGHNLCLDEGTIYRIRDQLVALAEEPNQDQLFLDFGNVAYVSSMTLGTLVALHKKLLAAGRRLTVHNLSPQVHKVFAVTRLDQFLDLRPNVPGMQVECVASPPGVLVVDDEVAMRTVLQFELQRQRFGVWAASHGQQAVELYCRHWAAIFLVLLDVLMPGMDGPHTLLALQKQCPAVQCCFMTGNRGPYTEETLLQMGAVRIFQKPFAFCEVIDTLKHLASQSSRRRQDRWIEIPQQRSMNNVDFESKSV